MFIPYNVDVPMQRWPIANWVIIGITTIVSMMVWSSETLEEKLACFRGDDFGVTQLLTHTLVHADIFHLAGNMLFLFVFGNAVNAKVGHALYLALYAVAGMVGAVGWMATTDVGELIGASGAIMGMVGAFLVFFPRNDISVAYWFGIFGGGTFAISAYWVIAFYVAFDIFGLATKDMEVAYVAHIGGAVTGFIGAAAMLAVKAVKPDSTEQTLFQALRGEGGESRRPEKRAVAPGPSAFRPPPSRPLPIDDEPIPLAGDEPPPPKPPIKSQSSAPPKPRAPQARPPTQTPRPKPPSG